MNKRISLVKKLFLKLLGNIQHGSINLIDHDNHHFFFGMPTHHVPAVTININHPRTYINILTKGSIGAAESYMQGDWVTNDLTQLIEIVINNQLLFKKIETLFAKSFISILRIVNLLRHNNRARAKKNILAHYDLGNEFFQLFLDPTMMYSSAVYSSPDLSLESAAVNKLDEICNQLQLRSSNKIIEIGSGWGGFALHAAIHYGCKVTTTTISDQQYQYLKAKIDRLGLTDKITVLNQDYRHLEGQYDKLVSIEMIEAVGHRYFDLFFEKCNKLIKPGGDFFLQTITINDEAYERAKNEIDFIKKYIFPGGCLPSLYCIFQSVARKTQMQLQHARTLGQDYALTINAWLERYRQKKSAVQALGHSERFIRMWEFYFCYCIAAFKQKHISNYQILWKKKG